MGRWTVTVCGAALAACLPLTAANAVPVRRTGAWTRDANAETPENIKASQWFVDALGVRKAHAVTKGAGVKVCLIDSLVDTANPALAGVHWGAAHEVDTPDHDLHATQMAIEIAGNGYKGAIGVAPQATVLREAITLAHGGQKGIPGNIKRCADEGAQVISFSLQGPPDAAKAIAYAQQRDVVFVAAAGNTGTKDTLLDAAGQYGVLAVTGTSRTLAGDEGSTWGGPVFAYSPGGGPQPDDHAGVAITGPSSNEHWSLSSCSPMVVPLGDEASQGCGTSPAAAIVAGVVALVRASHPELNAANVINRVLRTAKRPAGQKPGAPLPSARFGFGIIDAYAAVTAKVPVVQENPLGSMATGGRGVWDERVVPQRPEPPVGAHPAPSELAQVHLDDPATATARPTPQAPSSPGAGQTVGTAAPGAPGTAAAARTSSTAARLVPLAAGIGGLVALALGGAVVLRRRTARKR